MHRIFWFLLIGLPTIPSCAPPLIQQVMSVQPQIPEEVRTLEMKTPSGRVVRPGLFNHSRPVYEVYSGATERFAGTENGKLYSRAENDEEFSVILHPDEGWQWDIEGAIWSENGQYLLVKQINNKNVPTIELVSNSGKIKEIPYSRAGQVLPVHQYYIVNMDNGEKTKVQHDPQFPYIHTVSWRNEGKEAIMLQADRLLKQINIIRVDVSTGETAIILNEKSDTYLVGLELLQGYDYRLKEKKLIYFVEDSFIWTSERSGYNQLYLYNANGVLIRELTDFNKNGIVHEISNVDNEKGWVYYTAAGQAHRPYSRQLYRASLHDSKIEMLIEEPNVLGVLWGAQTDYFWALTSSMPDVLKVEKYTAAGTFLETHWSADLQFAKEAGYNPEYISLTLPGTEIAIETFILKPVDFDSTKIYPVVEYIYGGSFRTVIPRSQFEIQQWSLQGLANEGFIVVMTDGRGTPGRGKAFQDYIYGRMGQVEIADHAFALEKLCEKHAYMDQSRIGVMGHSWGGYFALKALTERPDLYKAAHLSAPAVEPVNFRIPVEIYMGCLPVDCPEKYAKAGVLQHLHNSNAPIQIIHGTGDDDVPVEESRRLVKKLAALGHTNYEFIEYPGMDHIVMRNPDWHHQVLAFFTDNLK